MSDTKEQILDAAETLFSEHGVEAVSLRRIIAEAGVNAAAIHYHFGPKETLVRAVFARRFDPLNRKRMALLDAVEAMAGDAPPAIEDIFTAVVEPAFRMSQESGSRNSFRALSGRLLTERPGFLESVFNDLFRALEQRVDDLVRRSLPDLPENELQWRKHMAVGSMIFVLREQEWIAKASGGLCDTQDVNSATRRLVSFMASGMKAPVIEPVASGSPSRNEAAETAEMAAIPAGRKKR